MGVEAVLEKLRNDPYVKGAFILEGEFYKEVLAEEGSVTESSMGMPLVNRALEEVLKRNTSVCIFCQNGFEVPMEHVVVLEDRDGNRVGHDVPICMVNDFKDDQEIFWLCDDFVVYPQKASGDISFIMLPQKVHIIGKDEGVENAVLMYPATTTDILLKKHFGIGPDMELASAILSFDRID